MRVQEQQEETPDAKYFYISLVSHAIILLALVLGVDYVTPMPVIQNTNQHDVISAVVLGDTPKSKIVPEQPSPPPPVAMEQPKPLLAPPRKIVRSSQPVNDVIALESARKKLADQKVLEEKMLQEKKLADKKLADKKLREMMEKNLMADLLNQSKKQKKIRQKQIESKFQKTLREQAEKSLRQQLLDEEIKLKGTQTRLAQGVVDKYKALIIQAISSHWIVPTQADKSLYSVLLIRVAPGGMVLDVQVTKSSGDPSLDSSAKVAVLNSSPLPVPSDPEAFEAFRQFVLKVKPENIIDGGLGAI